MHSLALPVLSLSSAQQKLSLDLVSNSNTQSLFL